MVENRKVRKFLDGIKFGPMDAGKATVILYLWIYNSFTLNIYYPHHFIHKKKKLHFRDMSAESQGCGVQRARGGREARGGGRGRGSGDGK